jgi:hypothetical protein
MASHGHANAPSFQQCVSGEANRGEKTAQEKLPGRVVPGIYVRCAGAFINENNAAITALGTATIALFTIVLAWATSRQARLTRETARLIEDQIKLARQEFIASHRPLMVVHAVRLLEPDSARTPDEQPLRAEFRVINAGTSACRVTGSAVYLDVLPEIDRPYLPDLPPNGLVPQRWYDVGTTDRADVGSTDFRGADLFFGTDDRPAYLSGWIVYQDNAGRARTTFFCRQCTDRFQRRFVPVDDPECEKTY